MTPARQNIYPEPTVGLFIKPVIPQMDFDRGEQVRQQNPDPKAK
jgi:hypothetical protein